jgi:6-phosphogluconolactonase
MTSAPEVHVVRDPSALFQAAASEFADQLRNAIRRRNRFTVALSGGSTPKALYSLLATNSSLPWGEVFFFFGDERHVPPDDPDSNYGMARESLLAKIPVPPANVFRVPAENPDASQAAASYEQALRDFFKTPSGGFPVIDLVLLGMGPDGHTASLFPGSQALGEKSRWVVSNWVEKFKTHRITLTLPLLNNANTVMFLVSGKDKATVLKEVLEGTQPGSEFPSKLIRPEHGRLIWMIDQAAAADLAGPRP